MQGLLGTKKKFQKEWLSEQTWEYIKDRKEMKAKLNEAKTRAEKLKLAAEYSAQNTRVKRSARSDKR